MVWVLFSLLTVRQVLETEEIKQAKRLKPLWYGGQWLKYKYEETWQIDYITLPQTCQGKRHVLTMVEATTRWLETSSAPCHRPEHYPGP